MSAHAAVPATEDRTDRRERRRSAVWVVALMVLSVALVWGHVWRYQTLSPIDELQHLDYLIKASHGHLVGNGDQFGQEALRIETCHRVDAAFDAKVQACVTDPSVALRPSDFQEGGYNTASIHPPTYYVVDGVLARVLSRVLPGDQDFLDAGRMAGVIWTIAAVGMLWLLFRELGARRLVAASLIVVLVAAPTVLHAAATINPDGTSLAAGAAMAWAVLRWERGRLGAWVPILFAAVAVGTKVTNLVGVGVMLLYLVIRMSWRPLAAGGPWGRRVREWARDNRGALTVGGGSLVAVGLVAGAWTVAQKVLERPGAGKVPMLTRFAVSSFPVSGLASSWQQTFDPLASPYLPAFLDTSAVVLVSSAVAVALVVGAVGGAVLGPPGSRQRILAVSALVTACAAGPLLVVFNAVVQGIYVVVPVRYALSAAPAMAAAGIPVAQRPTGRVVVVGLAVVSLAAVGVALVVG